MTEVYLLKSEETYLPTGFFSVKDVIDKYIQILIEYCIALSKQKVVMPNSNTFTFIILRGLETITHVFKYVLLYTRNLEAVCHHTHKSIYYYLEFISQITEQKNAFLQLSSKDAMTYVYKKTIYLLTNLVESTQPKSDIINTINMNLQIYKNATDHVILTRIEQTNISSMDIERLKETLIEIRTEKKKPIEWVKYFTELDVLNDD